MIINYENIVKYYIKRHFPGVFAYKTKRKEKKYIKNVNEVIAADCKAYEKNGKWPLFKTIEIETLNRCNNVCSFCPVNKNDDTRAFRKMDEALFREIIKKLQMVNYQGSIGIYSNNEPFLDERICDFARIAKERMPQNHLYLYTNGILLTVEKFKEIMQYLDRMYIDNYNDALKLIKPVKIIYDFAKNDVQYKDKVRIRLRKLNDVLFTRGGQAPNRITDRIEPLRFGCLLPFRQMVVRPDGKVSLCCNDALGKMTMGDLNTESIEEIWNSDQYSSIRCALTKGREGVTALCTNCDSLL